MFIFFFLIKCLQYRYHNRRHLIICLYDTFCFWFSLANDLAGSIENLRNVSPTQRRATRFFPFTQIPEFSPILAFISILSIFFSCECALFSIECRTSLHRWLPSALYLTEKCLMDLWTHCGQLTFTASLPDRRLKVALFGGSHRSVTERTFSSRGEKVKKETLLLSELTQTHRWTGENGFCAVCGLWVFVNLSAHVVF